MHKTVLAFNFMPQRLQALKLICMMLRVQLRSVERSEFNQPLGLLAGLVGLQAAEGEYEGEAAQEEMLLLCGFSRQDLDRLLLAIRKGALKQVQLKAMLTPTNCAWTALQLFDEISAEHAAMHSKGQE